MYVCMYVYVYIHYYGPLALISSASGKCKDLGDITSSPKHPIGSRKEEKNVKWKCLLFGQSNGLDRPLIEMHYKF